MAAREVLDAYTRLVSPRVRWPSASRLFLGRGSAVWFHASVSFSRGHLQSLRLVADMQHGSALVYRREQRAKYGRSVRRDESRYRRIVCEMMCWK